MSFGVGPGISLSQPPRWVPLSLRLRLAFAGALNQVGWLLLGIGSLVCWASEIPQATYRLVMFQGPVVATQALVTFSEETNTTINHHKVYQHTFEIKVNNETYLGYAFETGKSLKAGIRLPAEYPEGRPDLARLVGKRSSLLGWPSIFLAAIPSIGLWMVLAGLRRGRRWVKLLGQGIQTTGKLIERKATGTRINDHVVYKLTFEFRTEMDQICQAVVKTHHTQKLQDDAEESLFYLPNKPSVVTLLDHLPGNPEVDQMGEFRLTHSFKTWINLIVPTLALSSNAAYIYYRYFE